MTEGNVLANTTPSFWFSKKSLSCEEKLEKLCENIEVENRFKKLLECYVLSACDIPIEKFGYGTEIWKIYDDIDYIENEHEKKFGKPIAYPSWYYMKDFYTMANELCKKFDTEYEKVLCMDANETINGYKLYDIPNGNSLMRREDFERCVTMWKNNKQYNIDEFAELYEDTICSDWAKMDAHGDSYAGYWKYPEGSYERVNAWRLTRDANGKALWDLPYPKEVVIETIKFGCADRMECVRYSNFLCEWLKRKMEQMGLMEIKEIIEVNVDKIKISI